MTRIWIIDDQMSLPEAQQLLGDACPGLQVTEPEGDAFLGALDEAWDLILVDEELWDNQTPPHAVDGSSLVATLRAWARLNNKQLPGVVILTNKVTSFKDEIPAVGAWRPVFESFVGHEASVARTLDVEWLLAKSDQALPAKVEDLAASFIRARHCFGTGGISFEELVRYLNLPTYAAWVEHAKAGLRRARPPITEDEPERPQPPRGPATVLIWLLQRALPFPGLLVSDNYAALALGIRPEFLNRSLEQPDFRELSDCIYNGPLSSLFPRRWWTPGLDHFAIESERRGRDLVALLQLSPDEALPQRDSVVVYDGTLQEVGIASLEEAVRINPPGWPAEALQPWMRRVDSNGPSWVYEMVEAADLTSV